MNFLNRLHELKAQVLVIEQIEKRVVVGEVRQAMLLEKLHDGGMACLQFAQLLLGKAQHVEHFVLFPLVVGVEGLLQVVADADVIDDKALVLGVAADPVHAGDGLEEAVGDDDLVEIHHLLHRRVEAGQQHVVHDHDAHVAGDAFVLAAEGQLEALDAGLVL